VTGGPAPIRHPGPSAGPGARDARTGSPEATVNGWTFDPAGQAWYATIPAGADPRDSGPRTLLWASDYDHPPAATPRPGAGMHQRQRKDADHMNDERMSPELRAEVEDLQASMAAAAERRAPLPGRFTTDPDGSRVTITDTVTGRSTSVGLCDYGGARQVLAAFFGEDQPA
jgi:hypothetical protein